MNKYRRLLAGIAEEFGVERGTSESEEGWKSRIIYSLLGRMAYASLFDSLEAGEEKPDGSDSVSIVHLKRRVLDMLDTYQVLYPEIISEFYEKDKLPDEIYQIFLTTGCVYHTRYSISAAAPSYCKFAGLQFERGMPLNRKALISGIGAYQRNTEGMNGAKAYPSLQEMFGLEIERLSDFWHSLVSEANWTPFFGEDFVEYFSYNYLAQWADRPVKNAETSLLKIGRPGGHLYYLYRHEGNRLLASQLPNWQTTDPLYGGKAYRKITNACLAASNALPKIGYHVDGPTVTIKLKYLLPPAELNWIKLYSWPRNLKKLPNDFVRICTLSVFKAIQNRLEELGYEFVEG